MKRNSINNLLAGENTSPSVLVGRLLSAVEIDAVFGGAHNQTGGGTHSMCGGCTFDQNGGSYQMNGTSAG